MRNELVKTLTRIAASDRDMMLLTGDLGFGVLTDFAGRFPAQFLNVGVAEQNMIGIAVGLALEGRTVFAYSIGNFPTLRCLEQIRNDACYHNANVKIVAVGGGFTYGSLGISHHATEDIAVMRSMPGMTVMAPGDPKESAAATMAAYLRPGTCYLRLGRGGEPEVHPETLKFTAGEAIEVRDGDEVAVISTGGILKNALDLTDRLCGLGVSTALYSMHTVKPLDSALVKRLARTVRLIVTVEEHSVIGGLGSAVAEVLAQTPNSRATLKIAGLNDCFSSIVGDQEYLREAYGLSVERLTDAVTVLLKSLDAGGTALGA